MKKIVEDIKQFAQERDWQQYHSPDCLAKSISIEAAELLECFQWNCQDYDYKHVMEELADVMIYCIQMAIALDCDVEEIIYRKIEKNAKKYPLDKTKG